MTGGKWRRWFARRLMFVLIVLALVVSRAEAQIGSSRYASIVVDAQSGRVLSQVNADEARFPASLTKLMTLYVVFEAIRAGHLTLADAVPFSEWSSSMPPTKLGVPPGQAITVEQAILALVTRSANDAAAALGELLAGSEERFADLMTVRAHALGMNQTTFRNASGLPDWGQVTTARDLAVLARHLIQDFPEDYHFFGTPAFAFHGHTILNHQSMLRTYAGADGMKTGYTEASGYNVVTSAVRGGVRLIGVVMGASNNGERDLHMTALLDQGFEQMGVAPVEVARLPSPGRLALFGAAHAATLSPLPAYSREYPREYARRGGYASRGWAPPGETALLPRRPFATHGRATGPRGLRAMPRWLPASTEAEYRRRNTRG